MSFTQKKISEYNYVYSLELYARTTWVWSKIEKNSKFEFKIQVESFNSKFKFKIKFKL